VSEGRFIRVDLGTRVRFMLGPGIGVSTQSALVGRVDGRVVAWANLCQHHPLPLDAAEPGDSRDEHAGVRNAPMADDGVHFMCHSHGALYRPKDGLCVLGPCYGQRLFSIAVEETREEIALLL
jgi:nitrite reductase/ring-hydroxylating ferredoxin subunit